MMFNLYSIFDRKMAIYLSPFPSRGDVDAVRNVAAGYSQMRETPVGLHPEDFDLVCIGKFNDDTGEITRQTPNVIGVIADIVAKAPPNTVPS